MGKKKNRYRVEEDPVKRIEIVKKENREAKIEEMSGKGFFLLDEKEQGPSTIIMTFMSSA